MAASNLHIAWSELFARALAKSGVRDVVISPGSRSTPLVLGLCRVPQLSLHSVIDERAAGFFALGIARLTGAPVAVLCTSGTAAAHYLPAVMEASLARNPLVVVTADRPWDAYDCAAPQTVDQVKLYGSYVRHYAELGLPDLDALSAVSRVAVQSVARALGPDPGPVHINARFRKPLEPQRTEGPEPWLPAWKRAVESIPVVERAHERTASVSPALEAALEEPEVLVACGPSLGHESPATRARLLALLARNELPLLCESTSDLRFRRPEARSLTERGASGELMILRSVDSVCASKRWRAHGPKTVIELGLPMVSSAYAKWASDPSNPAQRIVFARNGYNDAASTARVALDADPLSLFAAIEPSAAAITGRRAWSRGWLSADARAQSAARAELDGAALTEGRTIAAVHESLCDDAVLIVGNSSVVRDIDAYALGPEPHVTVLHQRGASGIDGLVAGAVGARSVSKTPVVLLLGDVSLWHDVGSLQLAQSVTEPLVIVVLQNRGGRIFDRLPLGGQPEVRAEYERYFLTDRGQSFEPVARGFGLGYARVESASTLRDAMKTALRTGGATLIESVCAAGNAERFAALVRAGVAAIDGV
jgi:2-succinyl-5-enolpyruvyl-6-hydroxy-3-cyclohexene-1-carboxylate synthase